MKRPRTLTVVAFVAGLILHSTATFLAWTFSPGNMAVQPLSPPWLQVNALAILAAPLSWLLPESIATDFFWGVLALNSCLWALTAAAILAFLVPKRPSQVALQ